MTADATQRTIPRLALVGIFGGLFLGYVGLTVAIPVLPRFVRDSFGASDFEIGSTVLATGVTALLMRPVAGHLADRHGYRVVMRVGALIVAAGGLLYFLPTGLAGLIAIRLLLGVGEASLFTAGAVWTVSIAPHHRRGQLIGLYGVSMWGGISAGTFLGAVLLPLGFDAVWGLSAGLGFVALAVISVVPATSATRSSSGGGSLLLRPALVPGVALGLAAAGYAGLAAFVLLHLEERGIHSGAVVLSGFSLVYAGTRLFIGHLPDRLGPRRVAAWSGIGEAVGLLIIAVAPNLPVAVLGSVVMGIGFSLLHPSLALIVMNRTETAKQGAAIGAYTSFWDLGLAVWGPLTGAVAAGLGYAAVFFAGAVCAAAAAGVALTLRDPSPRPAATTEVGSTS
jgi:MFS family permease